VFGIIFDWKRVHKIMEEIPSVLLLYFVCHFIVSRVILQYGSDLPLISWKFTNVVRLQSKKSCYEKSYTVDQ
jgi:hypothetical protein